MRTPRLGAVGGWLALLLTLSPPGCERADRVGSAPADSGAPPESVTGLYEESRTPGADGVMVFVQGGPFSDLRSELGGALPFSNRKRIISVHQPWTLDRELLGHGPISLEEAGVLNSEAQALLDRVIRHLLETEPASGICVVGHSYGALLTTAWLADSDLRVPTVILAGRIDFPEEVWRGFADGRLYWFPDGRRPVELDGPAPPERAAAMRLQADLGRRPFDELLARRDLSHVTVVTGTEDQLVGRLTEAEMQFLERHGATVVELDGGGHRAAFEPAFEERLTSVLCGAEPGR